MPYIVLPDGSIRADSVEEAIALSMRMRAMPAHPQPPVASTAPARRPEAGWPLPEPAERFELTAPPPPRQAHSVQRHQRTSTSERDALAYSFLSAIANADHRGLGTAGMMSVFKVDHPRGIGSKSTMMKNYFQELGFAESDVYTKTLTPEDGTVFRPGAQLQDAMAAIAARLGSAAGSAG